MFELSVLQCVRNVAVHLGYGMEISLSASKFPLKCAVISLYSVVKQRLNSNAGKVCNCLIQLIQYRRSWTSLPLPFISAQRLSERTALLANVGIGGTCKSHFALSG
jgi:hypothetical protein